MSTTAVAAIEATGLVKFYEGRKVLADVSLKVQRGETIALTGANGSGKSTLLRVLAAASRPDEGTLSILGIEAIKAPDAARKQIALMHQEPALYDELTAVEHLSWWTRLTNRPGNPTELLEESGLSLHAHRRAGTLSRGQRQRLALAMAFLGNPEILLLDEPFTALDAQGQTWLEKKLTARRGTLTTILAIHATDAGRLADRVLHLNRHRLEAAK